MEAGGIFEKRAPETFRSDGGNGKCLSDCVSEYLVYLRSVLVLSDNTVSAYGNDLGQFLEMPWIDGKADVRSVRTEHLRQCIGELSRKKRAASSINRFIAAFRSMFAYCRKVGYIDVNPALAVKSVKAPKRLPRFMTQAEVDELCAQPSVNEILWEKRDRALFEMMYSSGCRVSEISGMSLSDVSPDFSQAVVTGKGRKDRIVYFGDDAVKAMREYIEDRKVRFSGHVFDCVDAGFGKNEAVDVVIRPEDVDIVPEEKGHLKGVVSSVTFLGVHYEIIVDIGGFKWMIQTTDFVDVDEHIGLYIEPDAIHVMRKSEYSGLYGDYSSFSNELDELSDAESEPDE